MSIARAIGAQGTPTFVVGDRPPRRGRLRGPARRHRRGPGAARELGEGGRPEARGGTGRGRPRPRSSADRAQSGGSNFRCRAQSLPRGRGLCTFCGKSTGGLSPPGTRTESRTWRKMPPRPSRRRSTIRAPLLSRRASTARWPMASPKPRFDPLSGLALPRRGIRHTYGALDLGTNNCRLLIARPAETGFVVIDAFSRVVRLGEGLGTSGKISEAAIDRALGALSICAEKLRRRRVTLARSVATEACRRAVNGRALRRARPARDGNRARHHLARGRSAARDARLPPAARARRRAGADLRHRRRIDRARPDRHRRRRAADQMLVVGALGRGLADRERKPRPRPTPRSGSPPMAGCASASAMPSAASPSCCPRSATTSG